MNRFQINKSERVTPLRPGESPLKILLLIGLFCVLSVGEVVGQKIKIPSVYSNLHRDSKGIYLDLNGRKIYTTNPPPTYRPSNFNKITGTPSGLRFEFLAASLNGVLYYGFIPLDDSKYPQPVFYSQTSPITKGVAQVRIMDMTGKFDMINWETNWKGILGYRVVDSNLKMLYDGKINFDAEGHVTSPKSMESGYRQVPLEPKPFVVVPSVIEGPLLANLSDKSVTIFCKTNTKTQIWINIGKKKFRSKGTSFHEVVITDLEPDTEYTYRLNYSKFSEEYSFRTAPSPGARTAFTFSYASDSRSGNGGGERNLGGTNAYIMKRIMALNLQNGARFMQFTGDMVTGYSLDPEALRLEYQNWKQAVSPYARYIPVITAMGNHESLLMAFHDDVAPQTIQIDNFPFRDFSAEAIYNQEFVNPLNGPDSEDGAAYDPDPDEMDFPSYKENVFHYQYDNVAMVVLNSNYWFAPSYNMVSVTGGNIHGYIMDQQVEWLRSTLEMYESDANIDHIFVTVHTPFFPNGGHVEDVMWYGGNNDMRPYVAGKAVSKGIIERRDELLDIIVNKSNKVKAILTGDEHNYARTHITAKTPIYPKRYSLPKLSLSRNIWQINNGAAGAPYYSQEKMPWTDSVQRFSTQNALVFFYVDGPSLKMVVYNPDTLEKVDELDFD